MIAKAQCLCLALLFMTGCSSVMLTMQMSSRCGGMLGVSANNNTSEAITTEVRSLEFLRLLKARTGKRVSLESFTLKMDSLGYSTERESGYAPEAEELLDKYIEMRASGHTKTYTMARLREEPNYAGLTPDCREILQEDKGAYIPWLWIYSFRNDGETNYTTYLILDGEIAWSYTLARRNDRSLVYCSVDAFDSKEVLPQYRAVFDEVNKKVESKMRANGSWEQFGSCHNYWALKKALLKERGIDWKSPKDLHPMACYD